MRYQKLWLILMIFGLLATGLYAQSDDATITGTWKVTVKPTSTSQPPSVALITFTADHNVIATQSIEPIVTQGVWSGSRSKFSLIGIAFEFDSFGHFIDTLTTTATVTLNRSGNSFTGTYGVTSASGVTSQSGTLTGTRIQPPSSSGESDN